MNRDITRHARTRMQQRSISGKDLELIMDFGTVVRPGLHMLRGRDVDKEVRDYKRRIDALERLRGCAAVVDGDTVVTCYHVSGSAGRRAVRRDGNRLRRPRGRGRP